MKKFPSVKYPSDPETDGLLDGEVVVTEKLDGANFRFTWDEDGTLHIGTRNVEYEDALDNENLPKAFEHAVEYIDQTVDTSDLPPHADQLVFYGEAMHLHSLDYDGIDWEIPSSGSRHVPLENDQPNVVLFDAWHEPSSRWLPWDTLEDWSDELGIPHTEVLARGDGETAKEEGWLDIPDWSMFGDHEPEGIVVRRTDGTVRAKKVSEDFKEQNAMAFEEPGKASTDSTQFVSAYITEARIEKEANKLIDEGEYDGLKMEMMEQLPRNVLTDAVEENAWDLLTSGGIEVTWDDDFKGEVRSKASTKCARVLKRMVQQF